MHFGLGLEELLVHEAFRGVNDFSILTMAIKNCGDGHALMIVDHKRYYLLDSRESHVLTDPHHRVVATEPAR